MYMLDTNIVIYAIKKKPKKVLDHISAHKPGELCISSITYAELVHGVEKSDHPDKNWIALSLMLSNFQILKFDEKAAEEYGLGYDLVAGANIAGFLKVAEAMLAQGVV